MSEIKWTAFVDSEPFAGAKILVAWMKFGAVEEAIGPFTYVSRTHFDARFTHWCPASVLPPVPAKRDYCREAWDKNPTWDGYADDMKEISIGCGSVGVTLTLYRIIWNAAIACAKEKGLENV